VCADSVTVALTEVRLGLAAAVISIPLRARLSPRAATDWFLTGRSVSATEARDQGLVTHVASADEMDAVVARVLDHLRAGARQGLVEAKRLLTTDLVAQFDSHGDEMARLSGLLFHSEVAQQRMAAALRR
jgi:enoyl-CoA hydratase/methylglutaconyl-CoA hydratase